MSDPATDIADYLASLAIGTIGTDLFAHAEPPQPADCVTVYNTGGPGGDYTIDFFQPTIQVRVRSVAPRDGFDKLAAIALALAIPVSFEVDGSHYVHAIPSTDAEPIGRDDKDRFITVQNFQMMRESA